MIALYLYMVTLFIRPQDWPGSPAYEWPVAVLLMIVGLGYGLYRYFLHRTPFHSLQNWLILALAFLAFFSNAVWGQPGVGLEQMQLVLKRWLVYVMFILILDTPQKIRNLLLVATVLAVILVFQGIYQNHTGVGWAMQKLHTSTAILSQDEMYEFEAFGTRIFWIGVWDGPNVMVLVFLFGLPLCLCYLFQAGLRVPYRILSGAGFALLSFGIFLTNSRGGFLAFGIVLLVFALLRFRKHHLPFAAGGLLLVLLVFAPARMSEMSTKESSMNERAELWEQALNHFQENPLTGIGKGQFEEKAHLLAHSNYVTMMTEMGIPGMVLFIAMTYLALKGAHFGYRRLRNHPEISGVSLMVLLLCAGFFATTFFVVMELEILYIVLALSSAALLCAERSGPRLQFRLGFRDFALILAISIAFVGVVWLASEEKIL